MMPQAPGEHASPSVAGRFAYDVFVVHADAATDKAFVDGYLLATLGLAPERVFRLQTLELGQFITKEIERGVRSIRVTIVVLSAAYMDDHWAAFGEQLAAFASVAQGSARRAAPAPPGGLRASPYVLASGVLTLRTLVPAGPSTTSLPVQSTLPRPFIQAITLPANP